MNTETGRVYESQAAALSDLRPGEPADNVVEVVGSLRAVERLVKSVQLTRATEKRRAKNKRARKSRRTNR